VIPLPNTPSIRICAVILHYGDPTLTDRVRRQLLDSEHELAPDIRVLDNAAPIPADGAWVRLPARCAGPSSA
jgi:hypothetical protein